MRERRQKSEAAKEQHCERAGKREKTKERKSEKAKEQHYYIAREQRMI